MIQRRHFDIAVNDAIDDAYESVEEAYRKATTKTVKEESSFKDIILACALVRTDEYGTFRLADLQTVLTEIKNQPVKLQFYVYHIGKLSESDRGSVLQKVGVKNQYRYRFQNPLVKAFVQLKNHQSHVAQTGGRNGRKSL